MALLYDQFGRAITPLKKPDTRPLSSAQIMDTWRDYVASGLTPQRLASLFREADAGDVRRQAELFDQLEEKDGHLLGEKSKRQNVILDLDYKLTPASEDSRDVKVVEFLQDEFIGRQADWDDVLVALQDAVGKGFASMEIDWDTSEGQALPKGFDFLEQKRFLFTDHRGYLRKHPLLLSDEATMGEEIPAWKCILHRYGGKSGHPTRSGVFRVCAWWYLFKNYSIKDWLAFCEVYGMPLRLGKYDPSASKEDKDALVAAIRTLGSDAAGIISKSTEIEFVETLSATARGDLYKELAKFGNAEISKAILGQTLTAEIGDKGSYAAAQTHNEVRLDLLRADGRAIASTVRDQVIRPIVGFNFGWDTPLPSFESFWEEGEDLKERSERDKNLCDQGIKFTRIYYQRSYNLQEDEFELTTPGQPAEPEKASASLKHACPGCGAIVGKATPADESPADTLDALGVKLLAAGDMDSLIDPARRLLDEVASLAEYRDRLLELYAGLDESTLGEMMTRALVLADLAGRFDSI